MNRQQQRSEETRSRIMEAAETCFAQQGYDATGVAKICQTARVSKGAFYHHFESKQAVFLALLTRWLAAMDTQLITDNVSAAGIPERIMAMSGITSHLLQTPREQLLIYLEFINKATRDPQVWQATIEPYHRYRDLITGMITTGVEEGSLNQVDAKTTANIIIALVVGLLIQGFLDPQAADWEEVTKEGLNYLLQGIKR